MMQNRTSNNNYQIVVTLTEKERAMAEKFAEQKGLPIGIAFKQALFNEIRRNAESSD